MFSEEFLEVLFQIITSWQVIAISVAILIYLSLVSYVAKAHHTPRVKRVKVKKEKNEAVLAAAPEESADSGGSNSNDDLGLEEA
jgi:hypothetical protein